MPKNLSLDKQPVTLRLSQLMLCRYRAAEAYIRKKFQGSKYDKRICQGRKVNDVHEWRTEWVYSPVKPNKILVKRPQPKQEAQLLLGDRATRKHAKDC